MARVHDRHLGPNRSGGARARARLPRRARASSGRADRLGLDADPRAAPQDPEDPELVPTGEDDTFQHQACLYIKYCQIFSKLHECYDQMVHPQKRMSVKKVRREGARALAAEPTV